MVRTALGWCLAYYGCGFLVGFLFGIPRVLQGDNPPASGANPGGAAAAGPAGYAQRVNTNLEQISDWLTKIIVGLGLVELRTVPDHLYRASDWMARSFAKAEAGAASQAAASFSSAFIVFFAIAGFMAGYLITRLFLAGAFGRADQQQPQTVAAPYQGGVDADIDKIKNFWKPGGVVDPAHEKLLNEWLTKKGIAESVVSFLSKPQYASQRAEVAEALPEIPRTVEAPYQGDVDADITKIKHFWQPGGVVDPAHEKELKTWLTENGIDESVVFFLINPQYTSQRAQAIRKIPIPQTETAS